MCFRRPASWMPWRTVHLGLDLKGGSYLLMEVDMKAVIKERLDSLLDAVRRHCGRAAFFIRPWKPSRSGTASCCGCAIRRKPMRRWPRCAPLVQRDEAKQRAGYGHCDPGGRHDHPDFSPVALHARAAARSAAVDRDRPPPDRRNRRRRSANHTAGRQPHHRATPRHRGSQPHQAIARQDRAHDVPSGG